MNAGCAEWTESCSQGSPVPEKLISKSGQESIRHDATQIKRL